MWYLRDMGGVGEFFWLGILNLLVLCGLVAAGLGGCGVFFGVVRWDVVRLFCLVS